MQLFSYENIYSILTFLDLLHNYLQYFLPLALAIYFSAVFKSPNFTQLYSVFAAGLILISLLVNGFGIYILLVFLGLVAIFYLYEFASKLQNFSRFLDGFILSSFYLFLLAQLILGGCLLTYLQNWLAEEFLNLPEWSKLYLFGSGVLPIIVVKLVYSVLILFLPLALVFKALKKSHSNPPL